MSRRRIEQMRIVVTGASSGIGRHLALELSRRGAQLVVTARRGDRLQSLAKEISGLGGTCHVVPGDITDPVHRQNLVMRSVDLLGGIDGLVNCAGIGAMGRFDQATPARLRTVFEVNFFAAAELIRLAIPHLKAGRKPIIVNISSVLGHRAVPLKSEYCASKFAIHGLSDSLRAELKPDGVDVLLVSPSTTDSDFFDSAIEGAGERDWKGRKAMPPARVANIAARAMRMGKHEVIISPGGISLVWLDRISPPLANYLIAKFAR